MSEGGILNRKFLGWEIYWWVADVGFFLIIIGGLVALTLVPNRSFIPGQRYRVTGNCPLIRVHSGKHRGELWPLRVYPKPDLELGNREDYPQFCDLKEFVFEGYIYSFWGEITYTDERGKIRNGFVWLLSLEEDQGFFYYPVFSEAEGIDEKNSN